MSLFYPPDEPAFRGKTSDREEMVNVRFVELAAPHRIVEALGFVTTDPAFFGEMALIATFEEVYGRTEVTLVCKNLPATLAGRGQRGRLAIESGAAGPPLRMTGWRESGREIEGSNPPDAPATRKLRHYPQGFA
jgi:uncharacterized protein YndB with AHSA1/START domain